MPAIIPNNIRINIIQEWLTGKPRNEIHNIYDISEGSIANIVREWRNDLGAYTADSLRELAVALRKIKLTPERCAIGFRVSRLMQKIGLSEEDFDYFISEVYDKCQLLEISPNDIASYLNEIIKMSQILVPSKIPEYLQQKEKEIKRIDQEYTEKKEKLYTLETEISKSEKRLAELSETEIISFETIEWYNNFRKELEQKDIPVNDINLLVQCVEGLKKQNFDLAQIINKYTNYKMFHSLIESQKKDSENKAKEIESLELRLYILKQEIEIKGSKITKLDQLENLGFGIEEFRHLYNIISGIAIENNMKTRSAIKKFFEDLNDYDAIFGFDDKLEKQLEETKKLNIQITAERTILRNQTLIGPILQNLLGKGINENDIFNINRVLSLTEHNYFGKEQLIQSLIQDLDKYRNIKQATKVLENSKKDLKKQYIFLENQKNIIATNIFLILLLWSRVYSDLQKFRYLFENPIQIFLLQIINTNKNTTSDSKQSSHGKNDNDSIQDDKQNNKI